MLTVVRYARGMLLLYLNLIIVAIGLDNCIVCLFVCLLTNI